MSIKLLGILEKYENDDQDDPLIKYTQPTHGGEGDLDQEVVIKQQRNVKLRNTLFLSELKGLIKENNQWLTVLFAILILVIIFLSVLIWRNQDKEVYFFSLLGGQGLSIVFCINRLSFLYNQKRTSELLLHLYNDSKSDVERSKIIKEIISFLKKKDESKKSNN